MLCHNFLYVRTYVLEYHRYVHVYVMSQLSDWKRAHMCTENHVCFGRIHGSQLREGANAGTCVLWPYVHRYVHVYSFQSVHRYNWYQ